MKRLYARTFTILLATITCLATSSMMGQSANHTVTVQVSTITALQVSSGTVNMTINGANAIAGQNTMTTTNTATNLLWGINSSLKKVTVKTSLASQKFALRVLALSPTQGTAAPEASLSTTSQDFLLNVGRSSGSCTIQYTGVALASQGTGTDAHTITFTVQTQ
jgi:hypothetical protein